MSKIALVFATAIAFASAAPEVSAQGATPPAYRAYVKSMKDHGLAALLPATSDFGPGYVFRMVATNGRSVPQTVCTNAFLQAPRIIDVSLPSTHRFSEGGLSAALKVAPTAATKNVEGSIGASASSVRTVDMTFGKIKAYEVPLVADYKADTGVTIERQINPACMIALNTLPRRGAKFSEKVFIVIRSTAPESFTFKLASQSGAALNLTAGLEGVASGEAGWKLKRINDQSFEIARDPAAPAAALQYVAADFRQLTNAASIGTVGATQRAMLSTVNPTAGDFAALSAPR